MDLFIQQVCHIGPNLTHNALQWHKYLQLEWVKLLSLTEYWLSLCALYYSSAKTEIYTVQCI